MKRLSATLAAVGALAAASAIADSSHLAQAQPAKGAPAAYERVREVMDDRFKDMKLAGDPDKDFAALLIAHHEDLIFLARTQLEHGGDEQLRRLAQKILDEQQKQISELKEWQVRNRQADYRAKADQPPHGSGPLDQTARAPAPQVQAAAPAQPAAQAPRQPASHGVRHGREGRRGRGQGHDRSRPDPEPGHGRHDHGVPGSGSRPCSRA